MNIAIVLAAVTAIATSAGGFLAIRSRDRLHLVLGLSAGLLLGLVAFDLLPEVFELNTQRFGNVPVVSIAFVAGFLALHFAEQIFGSHEPAESDYGHEHDHSVNIAGTLGALAMGGHVFLDGVALGLSFKISNALGFAVFIAILSHAFSDGLNTVSLLIKSGHWTKRAIALLLQRHEFALDEGLDARRQLVFDVLLESTQQVRRQNFVQRLHLTSLLDRAELGLEIFFVGEATSVHEVQ